MEFFAACSIKDMLRKCIGRGLPIERFHEMYCIQLNDTHPAIAVAELMRELIDKYGLPWDQAWKLPPVVLLHQITRCCPKPARNHDRHNARGGACGGRDGTSYFYRALQPILDPIDARADGLVVRPDLQFFNAPL